MQSRLSVSRPRCSASVRSSWKPSWRACWGRWSPPSRISASHALILVSGVRSSCDASIMNSLLMRSTSRSSAKTACSSSAVWAIWRARADTISRASSELASDTTKKRNSREASTSTSEWVERPGRGQPDADVQRADGGRAEDAAEDAEAQAADPDEHVEDDRQVGREAAGEVHERAGDRQVHGEDGQLGAPCPGRRPSTSASVALRLNMPQPPRIRLIAEVLATARLAGEVVADRGEDEHRPARRAR